MIPDFQPFANAVYKQFEKMSKSQLYVVGVPGQEFWETYLASFPDGTNPIYRERTVHDCNLDKNVIRAIGNVVSFSDDGDLISVWDIEEIGFPWDQISAALSEKAKTGSVTSVFLNQFPKLGARKTNAMIDDRIVTFNHLYIDIPRKFVSNDIGAVKGRIESARGVFVRGMEEITSDAISTVLDLINGNNLYRGSEFKAQLEKFKKLHADYRKTNRRDFFIWQNIMNPAAALKNSVIGTLLEDLSKGVELEAAVRMFETKVAPANYKRTTALVTPGMIKQALKTIQEAGLEPALDRRYARLSDVSVNDVIWADRKAKEVMKDGLEGLLLSSIKPKETKIKDAQTIKMKMEDFITTVVPNIQTGMEVYVQNAHQSNFVSVTAPENEDVPKLFNWDNNFAWSYDGEVTDSIKERVKKAGGNTSAKFRVSLSWFNTDDLDLHCRDPKGNHIYFGNKMGILDVDMNVVRPVRDAVENLSWVYVSDGIYKIEVNNYSKRENTDVGFTLEVEFNGALQHYSYKSACNGTVQCLEIELRGGQIADIRIKNKGLTGGNISTEKWGIKTETFIPVETLIYSPNYWGENATGNKHWIFLLKGCKNPGEVRGFYNEFLRPELTQHRKVFELLGSKTKCQYSDEQLSGLGFSSTRVGDSVKIKANNRIYEVTV